MSKHERLLVVDDEESMRELLEIVLGTEGFEVETAEDVGSALETLKARNFDAVLTDLRMGSDREAGMQVLAWLADNAPSTPAIMITAHGTVENAIEAMKIGAFDYVLKPFKNDEIRLLVRRAIDQRDILRENAALRKDQASRADIKNLIGTSEPVEEVREMIRRVATLPSTVAIHGESGSGKELVARGIHALSDRKDKPFVALNCGGFPENLLESELFGHKRGSFTGAVDDKEGLFVTADGGTLFLDEIGEMPLSLQVKLLRVLDDPVVMPVGGTTGVRVDVRIISATNRNLEEMAAEGKFREDLYYRLNVIPITVPPLRDRTADIPLLARHFAGQHAVKMGREAPKLASDAEEALRIYRWPGNVRELQNTMERAVALCRNGEILLEDLPPNLRDFAAKPQSPKANLSENGFDLEGYIADIEVDLIEQALKMAKYSQKRAAELLGLTTRSLRYRLQKYGLETS